MHVTATEETRDRTGPIWRRRWWRLGSLALMLGLLGNGQGFILGADGDEQDPVLTQLSAAVTVMVEQQDVASPRLVFRQGDTMIGAFVCPRNMSIEVSGQSVSGQSCTHCHGSGQRWSFQAGTVLDAEKGLIVSVAPNMAAEASGRRWTIRLADQQEVPAQEVVRDERSSLSLLRIVSSDDAATPDLQAAQLDERTPPLLSEVVTATPQTDGGVVVLRATTATDLTVDASGRVVFGLDRDAGPSAAGSPVFDRTSGRVVGVVVARQEGQQPATMVVPAKVLVTMSKELTDAKPTSETTPSPTETPETTPTDEPSGESETSDSATPAESPSVTVVGTAVTISGTESGRPGMIVIRRPRLGITGEGGTVIQSVVEGSPAAKADLKAGERVLTLNGQPVRTYTQLRTELSQRLPGDQIELTVRATDDSTRTVRVTLEAERSRPTDGPEPSRTGMFPTRYQLRAAEALGQDRFPTQPRTMVAGPTASSNLESQARSVTIDARTGAPVFGSTERSETTTRSVTIVESQPGHETPQRVVVGDRLFPSTPPTPVKETPPMPSGSAASGGTAPAPVRGTVTLAPTPPSRPAPPAEAQLYRRALDGLEAQSFRLETSVGQGQGQNQAPLTNSLRTFRVQDGSAPAVIRVERSQTEELLERVLQRLEAIERRLPTEPAAAPPAPAPAPPEAPTPPTGESTENP